MKTKKLNLKVLAVIAVSLTTLSGCTENKKSEEVTPAKEASSGVVKDSESSYDSSKRVLKS
ncbi:MAG: hypothetical protein RR659_05685, partial [Bacilli bacterium]